MHAARRNLSRGLIFFASLGVAMAALGADKPAVAKPEADDRTVIYRVDLLTDAMHPIAPKEMKEGCIYSHYSKQLERRVWSYVQADGTFWQAFGEGTSQEARRFDIRATEKEIKKHLEEMPELARQIETTGGRVLMELGADEKWKIAGAGLVASIYSAESGQRWERQGTQYIPVVHTSGNRWQVRDGRYQPR